MYQNNKKEGLTNINLAKEVGEMVTIIDERGKER